MSNSSIPLQILPAPDALLGLSSKRSPKMRSQTVWLLIWGDLFELPGIRKTHKILDHTLGYLKVLERLLKYRQARLTVFDSDWQKLPKFVPETF
jgi:hypothetical protein